MIGVVIHANRAFYNFSGCKRQHETFPKQIRNNMLINLAFNDIDHRLLIHVMFSNDKTQHQTASSSPDPKYNVADRMNKDKMLIHTLLYLVKEHVGF